MTQLDIALYVLFASACYLGGIFLVVCAFNPRRRDLALIVLGVAFVVVAAVSQAIGPPWLWFQRVR